MKQILITGGTGFIGSALVHKIQSSNCKLIVLSRQDNPGIAKFNNVEIIQNLNQIKKDTSLDAVINLAGEAIADKRWTKHRKQQLENSRIALTHELINVLKSLKTKPNVFISGSAVGFYGNGEDKFLSEISAPAIDYAHQLCHQWEMAARAAEDMGIRTCIIRTGLVVGKNGGFLKKMLPAFKVGLGGPLASGRQWMSWIHLQDMVHIIEFLLINEKCQGNYNATAPTPVTNLEFTKALNDALGKSLFFATPAWLLKLMFGEMSSLLLEGQRVIPQRLLDAGFTFRFNQINDAILDIVCHK